MEDFKVGDHVRIKHNGEYPLRLLAELENKHGFTFLITHIETQSTFIIKSILTHEQPTKIPLWPTHWFEKV